MHPIAHFPLKNHKHKLPFEEVNGPEARRDFFLKERSRLWPRWTTEKARNWGDLLEHQNQQRNTERATKNHEKDRKENVSLLSLCVAVAVAVAVTFASSFFSIISDPIISFFWFLEKKTQTQFFFWAFFLFRIYFYFVGFYSFFALFFEYLFSFWFLFLIFFWFCCVIVFHLFFLFFF